MKCMMRNQTSDMDDNAKGYMSVINMKPSVMDSWEGNEQKNDTTEPRCLLPKDKVYK